MIPVNTPHGEGYIMYVNDSGGFENDVFCVVLCETGNIKHYNTTQITVIRNQTYGIENKKQQ